MQAISQTESMEEKILLQKFSRVQGEILVEDLCLKTQEELVALYEQHGPWVRDSMLTEYLLEAAARTQDSGLVERMLKDHPELLEFPGQNNRPIVFSVCWGNKFQLIKTLILKYGADITKIAGNRDTVPRLLLDRWNCFKVPLEEKYELFCLVLSKVPPSLLEERSAGSRFTALHSLLKITACAWRQYKRLAKTPHFYSPEFMVAMEEYICLFECSKMVFARIEHPEEKLRALKKFRVSILGSRPGFDYDIWPEEVLGVLDCLKERYLKGYGCPSAPSAPPVWKTKSLAGFSKKELEEAYAEHGPWLWDEEFREALIHTVAKRGALELCQKILDEHPEFLELLCENERTPLFYALERGHFSLVSSLILKYKADVSLAAGNQDTIPVLLFQRWPSFKNESWELKAAIVKRIIFTVPGIFFWYPIPLSERTSIHYLVQNLARSWRTFKNSRELEETFDLEIAKEDENIRLLFSSLEQIFQKLEDPLIKIKELKDFRNTLEPFLWHALWPLEVDEIVEFLVVRLLSQNFRA